VGFDAPFFVLALALSAETPPHTHARPPGRDALASNLLALGLSAETLRSHLLALGLSAETLRSHLLALGLSAETLRSHLRALGLSAETLRFETSTYASRTLRASRPLAICRSSRFAGLTRATTLRQAIVSLVAERDGRGSLRRVFVCALVGPAHHVAVGLASARGRE
jgi:hypothetical protein